VEDLHGEESSTSLEREREMERVERIRKEAERLWPNRYKRQGASLVDALSCSKGTSEGDAIRVLPGTIPPLQLYWLGRYYI
jgi:hypothetical protein